MGNATKAGIFRYLWIFHYNITNLLVILPIIIYQPSPSLLLLHSSTINSLLALYLSGINSISLYYRFLNVKRVNVKGTRSISSLHYCDQKKDCSTVPYIVPESRSKSKNHVAARSTESGIIEINKNPKSEAHKSENSTSTRQSAPSCRN